MGERPRVGRPRDAEVDERILTAAFEIMSESGFRGLRADGLAARAGVPKSTVYRRWTSLADLAIDAIDARLGPRPPAPTDDPLADMVAILTEVHAILSRPGLARTLPQLALELTERPEAAAAYRTRVIAPLRDGAVSAVERAIAAGLWEGSDAVVSVDATIGALLYRVIYLGLVPTLDECFALAEAIARRPLPR